MPDLVKRLREDAEMWDAILGPGASITREAADAIEELTAVLEVVKHQLDGKWSLPPPVELAVNHLLSKYGASNG